MIQGFLRFFNCKHFQLPKGEVFAIALIGLSVSGLSRADTASDTGTASDADSGSLNTLTVIGRREKDDSTEAAAKQLKDVPGGVSLIPAEEVSNQHLTTAGDLLDFQPGIFVESAGNTGAPKISIRGSAINDGHLYFRTGIFYSFDGLPITGPSGTPFELWNPQDLANTSIYRGVAGLDVGAAELGGAINFTTRTGRDADLLQARFDTGSFGYYGGQVSSGSVVGPFDYYVSVSGFTADNFEVYNESRAHRVTADFGYQISPEIVSRLYFRYAYAFEESSWGISKAQIESDPSGPSVLNVLDQTRRENPSTYWIADRTDIKLDDHSSLWFGVDYHDYPIDGPGKIFGSTAWVFKDLSVVSHYSRDDKLFGLNDIFSINFLATTALNQQLWAYPPNGSLALAYTNLAAQTRFTHSNDINLDLSNELEVAQNLWISTAADAVETRRVNDFSVYPVPGILPDQDRRATDWQGRIAARYDVSSEVQVFGGIGRSVEAERAFDPINFGAGYVTGPQLKNQTAVTYEVGARAASSIFSGSLTLYREDVLHELLGVKIHPTDIQATYSNASPTTHQGVEFGLDTTLWQADASSAEAPHRVLLRQTYTYTWLHYNDDPVLGHNELPGVPEQFYEGELLYQHSSGFYAGVNTQYSSSYYVDYANTFTNDAFKLLGAKFGYSRRGGQWDVYLQAKNLTNVHYASSVLTQYDLHGQDSPLVFYPGDGRSAFGGFAFHYR
jgi:iron complex outermembrane receptor protein